MRGKIINSLFDWSVEDLRGEFCLFYFYDEMKIRVRQINDKFEEIKEMMNKQLKVHKNWENLI